MKTQHSQHTALLYGSGKTARLDWLADVAEGVEYLPRFTSPRPRTMQVLSRTTYSQSERTPTDPQLIPFARLADAASNSLNHQPPPAQTETSSRPSLHSVHLPTMEDSTADSLSNSRAITQGSSRNTPLARQTPTGQIIEPSSAKSTRSPTDCPPRRTTDGSDVPQTTPASERRPPISQNISQNSSARAGSPIDNRAGRVTVAPTAHIITPVPLPQIQQHQQAPAMVGYSCVAANFQDEMLNDKEADWEEELCHTL